MVLREGLEPSRLLKARASKTRMSAVPSSQLVAPPVGVEPTLAISKTAVLPLVGAILCVTLAPPVGNDPTHSGLEDLMLSSVGAKRNYLSLGVNDADVQESSPTIQSLQV